MSDTTPPTSAAYQELCKLMRESATLFAVSQLLNWDQETYMPPAAAGNRAEQQGAIAAILHERKTHPRVGELLAQCEADKDLTADADGPTAANLREMRRDYDRE